MSCPQSLQSLSPFPPQSPLLPSFNWEVTHRSVSNSLISCLSFSRMPGFSAIWSWWAVSVCVVGSCWFCSKSLQFQIHPWRPLERGVLVGEFWEIVLQYQSMWQKLRLYRRKKFYFNTKWVSFHSLTPGYLTITKILLSTQFSIQVLRCVYLSCWYRIFAVMWKTRELGCWVHFVTCGPLIWQV